MTDEETKVIVATEVTEFFAKVKEKINRKSWMPKK
jgi:hypothetical protein